MNRIVLKLGVFASCLYLSVMTVVLVGCQGLVPTAKEVNYVTSVTPTTNPLAGTSGAATLDTARQIAQTVGNDLPYGGLVLGGLTLITGLITGLAGGSVVGSKSAVQTALANQQVTHNATLAEVVSDVGGWLQKDTPWSVDTLKALLAAGLHDAATTGVQPTVGYSTTVTAAKPT